MDLHGSFWRNVDLSIPTHRKHIVSLYDGLIYYSDYIFNEVVKTLKENESYNNSIIILLSDHGEEFFEHGDKLHWQLFIETLHVPLMIKLPDNKFRGRIIYDQVRTMDLMPTLLQHLNIPISHPIQGISFLPLITNQGKYNPYILSYSDRHDSIRLDKDGYVYSNQPCVGGKEWLFSKEKDQEEQHNLVNKKPEILKQMRTEAKRIMEQDNAFLDHMKKDTRDLLKADETLLEQLKSLGYIN